MTPQEALARIIEHREIFPDEVLKWASADPEVSLLLRHHY